MKEKGFTLAELLGVLVILGVVAMIAIPSVNKAIKNGKEEAYQTQLKEIEKSTKDWTLKNTDSLPTVEGGSISITLGQLKQGGFLGLDIRDPKTGKLFPNDMYITVVRRMNSYVFFINTDSGTDRGDNVDANQPMIILNGNYLEYAEITTGAIEYRDLGVVAKKSDGTIINPSSVMIQYKLNGTEVGKILTNAYNTYTISYTVIDNGLTATVTRTVIIRDTTPPELTIPDNVTISVDQVSQLKLADGVTITDNSGEVLTPVIKGNISTIPGEYIISYIATDSHGNSVTKKRVITVTNEADKSLKGNIIKQGVITTGSGLYKINDTEYRYRGGCTLKGSSGSYTCANTDPINNYVSIGGQKYRIISVDSQGVKVMSEKRLSSYQIYDKGNVSSTSCTGATCPRNNANNTFCQVTSGTYFGCNVYAAVSGNFIAGSKTGTVTQNSSLYDYLNTTGTEAEVKNLRDKALPVTWNIGAVTTSANAPLSTITTQEKAATATFKLGLINTSDYISGSIDTNCQNDSLSYSTNSQACRNNNWLFDKDSYYPWTINPYAGNSSNVWLVYSTNGTLSSDNAYYSFGVRPTGYLSSDTLVTGGDGTSSNPWVIK